MCAATFADVSHLHNYEPQYNLEPAATNTHRPIYTIPPTRYDQVVAASSHAEKYSYDPPASQFNPYDAASERRSTYTSSPQRDYYHGAASVPNPTYTTFASRPRPTVSVNDKRYNYNGQQDQFGAASAFRQTYDTTYSGIPTYAGYQQTASASQSKPSFTPTQRLNTFKPTYAGYQPISSSSENRRPTYAGYEPSPAASELGYQYNVAAPSYQSNVYTPSYNSRRTSYQTPTAPTYNHLSSSTVQRNTYTQAPTYPTREQMKSGRYYHQASSNNGQYNHQGSGKTGQYQHQTTRQYQPQSTVQGIYYAQRSYEAPSQQTHNYESAATRVDAGVVKSDGYHYDKPSIPFDPAPERTPDAPSRLYEDAPSRLYEDAPPPPPVRRPSNPPPQYRKPTPPTNYRKPAPTPNPFVFNSRPTAPINPDVYSLPTPAPVRFNPAPVVTRPTPPTVDFNPRPTPPPVKTTSLTRVEEIDQILNTTPNPPIVRITPRTTARPRATAQPIVNTTPFIVTFPPPKVSDVVLLAYSASTISPDISVDVYSPPPDVGQTVRPYKASDRVLERKQPNNLFSPAPFLATKPVNPIKRSELQTSASEDQFQYLPPESPTFGGLREDGYHYQKPNIPFY